MNTIKAKMDAGEIAFGIGFSLLRGNAAPLLAKAAGCDWIFIDMEHGAFTLREVSEICMASLACGVVPVVRCRIGALDEAARLLDNGALGIVVPHVDTADEAREIASALRLPPKGVRAWGGSAVAFGYRPPDAGAASIEIDRNILVMATIESGKSVANVDEIASIEGIDVLLFGATDLTLDLGFPGQIEHEEVFAAFSATAAACSKYGKILGFGGATPKLAERFLPLGARLVLTGGDHALLLATFDQRVASFKALTYQVAKQREEARMGPGAR